MIRLKTKIFALACLIFLVGLGALACWIFIDGIALPDFNKFNNLGIGIPGI